MKEFACLHPYLNFEIPPQSIPCADIQWSIRIVGNTHEELYHALILCYATRSSRMGFTLAPISSWGRDSTLFGIWAALVSFGRIFLIINLFLLINIAPFYSKPKLKTYNLNSFPLFANFHLDDLVILAVDYKMKEGRVDCGLVGMIMVFIRFCVL